jgi:predicted HTH transcriptional regulator
MLKIKNPDKFKKLIENTESILKINWGAVAFELFGRMRMVAQIGSGINRMTDLMQADKLTLSKI